MIHQLLHFTLATALLLFILLGAWTLATAEDGWWWIAVLVA